MGTVIVIAVGVSILSFVLADVLGPGSALFGGQSNTVGEIAGQTIQTPEYQSAIEIMTEKFSLRNQRRPSDVESNTIREQAWEKLIADIAFRDQFSILGINVTKEEEVDLVQGKNIHPDLRASFTNPETGEFSASAIVDFLSNYENYPVETKIAWASLEEDILSGRRRIKYDNLMIKSSVASLEESKRAYESQTEVAELNYLYIPYYAIGDSSVTVTDSELAAYLKGHTKEYEVDQTRALKYVTFPVLPSGVDSADFQLEMEEIEAEFARSTDDSIYARNHTEIGTGFTKYNVDALPLVLQSDFESITTGAVYGPFIDNGYHTVYKITDILDDTIYTARAKHILIKPTDQSIEGKAEAKDKAEEILRDLKGGADFAEMAGLHSTDPGSASQGGDVGWFRPGRMVEPFQDAIFDATSTGLLDAPVETEFGYHIISVTNVKTNKAFKISSVSRLLVPSENSRDVAYRKADLFRGNSSDLESFESNADSDGINVYDAPNVDKNARRFGTLGNARQIVSWLFRDASQGSVSKVYEIDDNYIIAVMTGETEEGTAPLENVKNEVTLKVKNQKKSAVIISKLQSMEGDLNQLAEAYGTDATVYSTSDLKLSSNSIPNVGFAPEAVGKAFALAPGARTAPFASENGVLILELVSKTPAPEIADYSLYSQQLQQQLENRTSFNISNAVKKFADIKDQRYKFF